MEGDPEFLSHLQQLGSEYKRLKEQHAESRQLAETLQKQNAQLAKANQELAELRLELLAENRTLIEKLQSTTQEKSVLLQQQQQQQKQQQLLQQELQLLQQQHEAAAAAAEAALEHVNRRLTEDSQKAAAKAAAIKKELEEAQLAAASYRSEAEDKEAKLTETNSRLALVNPKPLHSIYIAVLFVLPRV